MQAWHFECLLFVPFWVILDGCAASKVAVGRRDVVQALLVAPMIVVVDECLDLGFEITGQELVFQQDAVLKGLVPAFDLARAWRVAAPAA